jgi:hypothetical protein
VQERARQGGVPTSGVRGLQGETEMTAGITRALIYFPNQAPRQIIVGLEGVTDIKFFSGGDGAFDCLRYRWNDEEITVNGVPHEFARPTGDSA